MSGMVTYRSYTMRILFEEIVYKLERFVNYLRYDIPQGLYKLWIYFPYIWSTREWDQAYLYELIIFKMRQMEKNFRDNPICEKDEESAEQIRLAADALERVVKDEYPGFLEFYRASKKEKIVGDFKALFDKDEQMIKADLKLFTDYFRDYSRTWWN
jgi:hypothetical protein